VRSYLRANRRRLREGIEEYQLEVGAETDALAPSAVLTKSFNSLLGLKNGIFLALTSTFSPVFGLRPTRPRRSRVRKQLREHNVSTMFLAKVCSEDAPRRKPHPAPLRMALEKLRALPQASVYIGDAPEDIEMAHRAGMRAIGVLGGSPVPGRLRAASPDAMIETIRDLPALLKSF